MTEPDPRFLAGENVVLTDTSKVAWAVVADWDGAVDMRAHVDKPTMAAQLRHIADQLDPAPVPPPREAPTTPPTLGDVAPLQPCTHCLDARFSALAPVPHRCPNDAAPWPTEPADGCLHVDTDAGGNCRNPLCGWNSDWARATEVDADD